MNFSGDLDFLDNQPFLPTSEEQTQNLMHRNSRFPSGVTSFSRGENFTGFATEATN